MKLNPSLIFILCVTVDIICDVHKLSRVLLCSGSNNSNLLEYDWWSQLQFSLRIQYFQECKKYLSDVDKSLCINSSIEGFHDKLQIMVI